MKKQFFFLFVISSQWMVFGALKRAGGPLGRLSVKKDLSVVRMQGGISYALSDRIATHANNALKKAAQRGERLGVELLSEGRLFQVKARNFAELQERIQKLTGYETADQVITTASAGVEIKLRPSLRDVYALYTLGCDLAVGLKKQ